ncbi:MAG TPA: helix-turn-helix transcriptional regulator [Stellaceae bacterium]|jgi:DNA-binding XRE family transcriptional regulator|nr:helix-turn-helix transcriptional regulator [Stellaceae bacterium]
MTQRHSDRPAQHRIRAAGEATELAALIADRIPEVRLVDDDDTAEFVLVTADELAEMVEDRGAQAAYERTRSEDTVPIAVVDRLLAGENPVRVWREQRGLTLTALAGAAGLGKSYLSQLERGTRQGPVATMQRLAAALGVDLDDLT